MEKPVAWFQLQIKKIAVGEDENFGSEKSNVRVEKYPLIVSPVKSLLLNRRFE